jgi:hypothetical protein
MEFPGLVSTEGISSGTVIMDDLAERAAVYAGKLRGCLSLFFVAFSLFCGAESRRSYENA